MLVPSGRTLGVRRSILLFACAVMSHTVRGIAQQACPNGIRIEGTVTDPTGAAIVGATVRTSSGETALSGATGDFRFACIPGSSVPLHVEANGFTSTTVTAEEQLGNTALVSARLAIAAATADVQVTADAANALDTTSGAGTTTLNEDDIRQLPDDPDDLLQQLQLLASTGGGASTSANVVVDGFQNGSALPPKSSIASIRVNPDPISPEYERPDAQGGRIEITTKPGAASFHGALFLTDSDGSFNATDPFSVTSTPAGRRRYGFELSGPILTQKSGFALALEKRDIDEFNVVNALQLGPNGDLGPAGNGVPLLETVPASQRLWIASGRSDAQITPKDLATISYAANVNNRTNQGVGGFTTAEAGYSSQIAEYDLRFTNAYTFNANMLHETRIGYTWKRTEEAPNSSSPSLQVAGYFNGGGAITQNLNDRERDLEIDDDVMIVRGKHQIKIGAQSLGIFVHNYNPNTFNGAYVFGGGAAPALDGSGNPTGQTITIKPLEQYRRALYGLPGGTPTTYQITMGNPLVPYTQWRLALFAEDTIKLQPRLTVTGGLRYSFQTSPDTFVNFAPRLGVAWSPDKKSSWTLHARVGLFNVPVDTTNADQAYRLNGIRQTQTTVYSPSYAAPLVPISGSAQVGTRWQFTHAFEQIPVGEFAVGIERDLPHHWHPNVWFTWSSAWGDPRTVNINAPYVASSAGAAPDPVAALNSPRPGAPNLNVFELQNSAHNRGGVFWVGIEQKSYKHWTLNLGLWNVNFRTNGGTLQSIGGTPQPAGATPQSTYSKQGESARPDWQSSGALVESDLRFPFKLVLSTQVYWHYGTPYNLTTGVDANGDGTFNDRPSFSSVTGDGTQQTPYGLMTVNTVNGNVSRNLGTMPVIVHMYSNLSRAFDFGDKDHVRTLTFNARAVNLLNHTNITAVGTVVSSSSLGQPLAAEAARRLELGTRFSF
jgi:hypothetical protein